MNVKNVSWFAVLLLLTAILGACSGLAGDVEIVRTFEPPPTANPALAAAENFDGTVNLALGASIYAQNCTRCHGATGAGDGELVLNGQITSIPDFTNPETIQDESLQSWFDTITNGRLENLMPPWADSLSPQERWAVALYTYSMSYDEATIAQGQADYEASCASCHATDGTGTEDGSSLVGLMDFNEADLAAMLTTHATELELDLDSVDAVLQYTRLLSSDTRALPDADAIASVPQVATTEEAAVPQAPQATVEIPQSVGTITGQIIQGTEGGGAVEGLTAVVHIYDARLTEQIAEYVVGADGTYQYDEVVIRPDFAYRITTNYQGITYSSPIRVGDPNVTDMQIDVTVYETGAPADALEITSHAIQANLSNQGLYIIEVIDMVNNSDRAYLREDVEGISEPVSVSFAIPEGAQLQLEHTDPNRILLGEDGVTVYDNVPVQPNSEHYVQFSYLLPLDNAQNLEIPVNYTIAGPIAYFIENRHLTFESDDFVRVDTRVFNGQEYGVYQIQSNFAIGDAISYSIDIDDNPLVSDTVSSPTVSREVIALVMVIIGVIFVVIAGVLIWRTRDGAPPSDVAADTGAEKLMQQIAELDDKFDAGDISKAEYTQQRNTLKAQLRELMKQQSD